MHYFLIALRNIKRHKGYFLTNISGLAMGLACCIFIALWISDESDYDKFLKDSRQIYQVLGNGRHSSTPFPLAPALKESCPEVIYACRTEWFGESLFRHGSVSAYMDRILAADTDFFQAS